MELLVPKLTHTFLRMVVFLVLAMLLMAPVTPAFAVHTDNPADHAVPVVTPPVVTPPVSGPTGAPVTVTTPAETGAAPTGIDGFVYNTSIRIGGWVAWLGGTALEYTFSRFVIKLGCYFTVNVNAAACTLADGSVVGDSGTIGGVVNELWQVIRDFFNILFIFALVLIGFRLILNADDSGARKSLTALVGAALLVNFSLYIAKLVLDIANFTATQIYSAFQVTGAFSMTINGTTDTAYIFNEYGIAGAFMQTLQVTSFFAMTESLSGQAILFGLMAMFFLMFLGAIFLYGAVMILVRFIALTLLLILSPALFLGWVVPSWKSYSQKWRQMFVAYSFFAPAYVFMIYLSLFILMQLQKSFEDSSYADAFVVGDTVGAGTPGNAEIFVFFFIGAALLFASTKVAGAAASAGAGATMNMADGWAKKLSGAGAMISAGQALPGKVGGAASYTAGYLPRYGVNALGSKTETAINNLQARGGAVGWVARTRGADAVGRGAAKKMKEAQVGTGTTNEKESKHSSEINEKAKQTRAIQSIEAALASGNTVAIKKALGDATNKQIEEIAKTDSGQAHLLTYAKYLNKDKVKAVKDSKDEGIKDSYKEELDKAFKAGSKQDLLTNLGAAATAAGTIPAGTEIKTLNKASKDQLEAVGTVALLEDQNAVRLTKKQIDSLEELKNDGKISQRDFDDIKSKREAGLLAIARGTPLTGMLAGSTLNKAGLYASAEAVPELPSAVIVSLAKDLNRAALRKVAEKCDPTTQRGVRTAIMSDPTVTPPTPPAGVALADMDQGTMSAGEKKYMFLNFDPIGKDLGL